MSEAECLALVQAHRLARLSLDEGFGPTARWEPEPVTIRLGGVAVPLPEGAFLQATADGEAALVAAMLEAVGPAEHTADLFAGLGTFALALPGAVLAAEGARDAILALAGAANRAGRHVKAEHRDLFRRPLTAKELAGFDAVVLDPPRAGAKEQVIELAASGVPRIAYVSCNPTTFARDARELVTTLLTRYGATVTPTSSCEEALIALTDAAACERFDVIVSDIGLPGEDGYSLVRKVRELTPALGGAIPAVALTAYGRSVDRVKALSAGFQMHVPKPVEPVELAMVITSLTRRASIDTVA